MVLSRIKVCLRLFFAGSTQLFDNYLRFLGFFVGYCVRFIEFSWDLKYFTCCLWRIIMCWPNSSNFFLLYGHMCYVMIVILQILPIFNGSAENYTVFALTFRGVYPIFFMIIYGLRVCWWVNAFCSSDLLEIWNILTVVCGELWCVVRIHRIFCCFMVTCGMLRWLFY